MNTTHASQITSKTKYKYPTRILRLNRQVIHLAIYRLFEFYFSNLFTCNSPISCHHLIAYISIEFTTAKLILVLDLVSSHKHKKTENARRWKYITLCTATVSFSSAHPNIRSISQLPFFHNSHVSIDRFLHNYKLKKRL